MQADVVADRWDVGSTPGIQHVVYLGMADEVLNGQHQDGGRSY